MYRFILFFTIFFLFIFLFRCPVSATDVYVRCDGSQCTGLDNNSLFPPNENWYPGKWIAKTMSVENNDTQLPISVSVSLNNPITDSSPCSLESKLQLSITRLEKEGTSTIVWVGSVADMEKVQGFTRLAVLPVRSVANFQFTISLNQETSDECQGKTTGFDISMNLESDAITITPGSQREAIGCTNAMPSDIPKLTSATPGYNTVTLRWQKSISPITGYIIGYGTVPKQYTSFISNVGGAETTQYSLIGLKTEMPYYFAIRAVNGCAMGAYSNELNASIPKPIEKQVGQKVGTKSGEVLGVQQEKPTSMNVDVLSVTDKIKKNEWMIGVILFTFLLLGIILFLAIKKRRSKHSQ